MTKKIASILVLCLQLACGVLSTPEPTATPQPTSTSTPVPTATHTSTPTPEIDFGDMAFLAVVEGFTISIPFPYVHEVDDNIIVITNEERSLFISFTSKAYDLSPLEDVIDEYLASLENKGGRFEKSSAEDIVVDGFIGVAIDIKGQIGERRPIVGRAIAVSPNADLVLFGLATTDITNGEGQWEAEHQGVFEKFVESIKFVDSNSACIISTDETYGYTESNPIKIGGDFISGPSRERAYLENLLGPNGESLSYERQGSTAGVDVILDAYRVTGSGVNEVLYIDMYNFEEPQAPVGFTCKGAFPLSTP